MRSLASILFLSLLLLLQYGRGISYLGCRLEGMLSTEKVTCDCDVKPTAATPFTSIPANQHLHVSFDDFDAAPTTITIVPSPFVSFHSQKVASSICRGYGRLPEQPPSLFRS